MARIHTSKILDANQNLEFFTGSEWNEVTVDAASTIIPFQGPQVSIKWNEYLQSFVTTSIGSNGDIYFYTAPKPWGPWSWPVLVHSIPVEKLMEGWAYCIYLHPELFRENGRIMAFTYCLTNGGDGLPHLVEVTLDKG